MIADSSILRTSLGEGLRARGYAVDVVTGSLQAIAHAADQDYDIIILDLMLPKESSLRVLHEIREANREVEILILSARDQIHDRVTALIQGADDYLETPFSFDELHAWIQDLACRKTNHNMPLVECEDTGKPKRYLDRLIGNLLQLCGNDADDIELVISEVKLATMLGRVSSTLRPVAREKEIRLQQPRSRLPTLLVDARWMEQLLSNLMFSAISYCPAGSEIRIQAHQDNEYCRIDIESPADEAFELSLIKSYATYLNLEISSCLSADNLYRVSISNIKIV